MDVWFDSGTSWSMLKDLRHADSGKESGYLADVCIEGSDQHRGWFQSQLLTLVGSSSAETRSKVSPYGTLITHGMVLDEEGKKMSKSLGNIVSPLTVINGGKVRHFTSSSDSQRLLITTYRTRKRTLRTAQKCSDYGPPPEHTGTTPPSDRRPSHKRKRCIASCETLSALSLATSETSDLLLSNR